MERKSIFDSVYTSKYFKDLPDFAQKKTQAFITITLTLITVGIFGIFAITPTITTILNLQKQKDDNTFVEQQLDQKRDSLARLTAQYASIEPDLPFVYAAIPQKTDVPNFIGELYALGKLSNVTILRVESTEVDLTKINDGAQGFSSFGFTVEVSGRYTDLLAYLKSLTNFQRIITFNSLTITKADQKDTTLKMSIRGKAYFKQ